MHCSMDMQTMSHLSRMIRVRHKSKGPLLKQREQETPIFSFGPNSSC